MALILFIFLSCGKESRNFDVPDCDNCNTPELFKVSGRIIGLIRDGLTIELNNKDNRIDIPATSDRFSFNLELRNESLYYVSIQSQPTGQTCSIADNSGIGIINGSNITNVTIVCDERSYTVGGTIISPIIFSNLGLTNIDTNEDLTVDSGSTFSFLENIAYGGSYNVVVKNNPQYLRCTPSNSSGTDVSMDITSILITCVYGSYSFGGSFVGLASGLSLTLVNSFIGIYDDSTTESILLEGNGDIIVPIEFTKKYTYQASYNVSVQNIPTGYNCLLSNNSGDALGMDIADISLNCDLIKYSINGILNGLPSNNFIDLTNNSDTTLDSITVEGGESSVIFSFPEKVNYGGSYNVSIQQQPPHYYCEIDKSAKDNLTSDISDIEVNCKRKLTVGGVLKNVPQNVPIELLLTVDSTDDSTTDNLTVYGQGSSSVPFLFNEEIIPGSNYTVNANYSDHPCYISNNTANGILENISDVTVDCSFSVKEISSSDSFNYSSISLSPSGIIYLGAVSSPNSLGGAYRVTQQQAPPESFAVSSREIYSIVSDTNGYIYISDSLDQEIIKYDSNGILQARLGSDYNFSQPAGISIAPDGQIYVADYGNKTIVEILTDGSLGSVIDTSPDSPFMVTTNSDFIYVSLTDEYQDIYINKIDRTDGSSSLFDNLYDPWAIEVDQNDNVFFTDSKKEKIIKISNTGEVTEIGPQIKSIKGLSVKELENKFYVATGDGYVQEITEYP